MQGQWSGKICRRAAPIADRKRCSGIAKAIISLDFLPWHGACSPVSRLLSKLLIRSSAMLPAIGAASAALDAIQSLTSPQPGSSSQSADFFGSFSAGDSSAASSAQSTVFGFSTAQISSANLNALFDAQSRSSGNVAGAPDSDSSSSDSSSASAPGMASSAYNAINQLTQTAAIPLAFSPFSVSA